MGSSLLTENPFAVLTFIAAPAILTNATSVLAMSTINRMLRTRDRMHELFREPENAAKTHTGKFIEQVNVWNGRRRFCWAPCTGFMWRWPRRLSGQGWQHGEE